MMSIHRVSLCFFFFAVFCSAGFAAPDNAPVYVIGQDVRSIEDYMGSLKDYAAIKNIHYPDGIMAYTAINDLRGLSEPVDHGAGINNTDELLRKYPDCRIVQIGLYMKFLLDETILGSFDTQIYRLGTWIKNSGKQVYLRIGYEFDNPDNNYDPKLYIKAYRYIVDRLRKMNIPNVDFVWHTIAWKGESWPDYDPVKWYPGDQYVDWVGISFFDNQRDIERDAAAQLAQKIGKPIMIAESSPFNRYTVKEKLEWMKKLFEYIKTNNVKFLSYINVHWDALPLFEKEKWGDARLEKSPVLMKEWLSRIEYYRW